VPAAGSTEKNAAPSVTATLKARTPTPSFQTWKVLCVSTSPKFRLSASFAIDVRTAPHSPAMCAKSKRFTVELWVEISPAAELVLVRAVGRQPVLGQDEKVGYVNVAVSIEVRKAIAEAESCTVCGLSSAAP